MAEPIQVVYSDKGKKGGRRKPIVISPERAGLRVLLSLTGTVITALVGFYVMLPPLNFRAQNQRADQYQQNKSQRDGLRIRELQFDHFQHDLSSAT